MISSQSGTAFYYSELQASQLRKFEPACFPRTLINSISWCNCISRLCVLCFFRPNFLLFPYSFLVNDIYMQTRAAIDFHYFTTCSINYTSICRLIHWMFTVDFFMSHNESNFRKFQPGNFLEPLRFKFDLTINITFSLNN